MLDKFGESFENLDSISESERAGVATSSITSWPKASPSRISSTATWWFKKCFSCGNCGCCSSSCSCCGSCCSCCCCPCSCCCPIASRSGSLLWLRLGVRIPYALDLIWDITVNLDCGIRSLWDFFFWLHLACVFATVAMHSCLYHYYAQLMAVNSRGAQSCNQNRKNDCFRSTLYQTSAR